jgi:hypothetical protein
VLLRALPSLNELIVLDLDSVEREDLRDLRGLVVLRVLLNAKLVATKATPATPAMTKGSNNILYYYILY